MISRKAEKLLRNRKMRLRDLLDRYVTSVECSQRYVESLRRTVRKAEANGLQKICQLSPEAANRFLAELPLSAVTVGNIRRELMTLWRYAFDEKLTEVYPHRIRRIRQTSQPPTCWTQGELAHMWDLAKADQTPISDRVSVRRCHVMPAWISIGYDTALRFSDVHNLRSSQVVRGFVTTTALKTGKAVVRQLSPASIAEVEALVRMSPDGSLFKWCLPRRRALLMWRSFLDEHGLKGSSKWLRRCAATAVEMRERGSATAFLQHSAAHLAIRHYIDQTQISAPLPPPPINGQAFRAAGRIAACCEG